MAASHRALIPGLALKDNSKGYNYGCMKNCEIQYCETLNKFKEFKVNDSARQLVDLHTGTCAESSSTIID